MKEQFLALLNKVINDELSAVTFYQRAGAELVGPNVKQVADELQVHANEEYGHFLELINYASNYDLLIHMNIALDNEVANYPIQSLENVMMKVQELESIAVTDYESLLMMSREMRDFTGVELFKDILEDEIGHYDDLAYVLGQTRVLFPEDGNNDMDGIVDEVIDQPIDDLAVSTALPVEADAEPIIEQPVLEGTENNNTQARFKFLKN